ncbi:phosphoesterase [Paenibacillus swuensis]|uniref:Phosphoesterase n=1 Tax=Paenibacillus swuensis TaxID=1178515 RepID=A0A172TH56_9BACL|nr:phosphatase PAP2 family protein [Paenibacillus swuensis]ANE46302.1 phosphoesterase [Paenibacillus swuensis]
MSRVVTWLQRHENRMFFWANHKLNHAVLDYLFSYITHLGGATFTIACSVLTAIFAPAPWNTVGLQAMTALAVSHIPVAIIKKKYPRLRPYLVLPQTNIGKSQLTDHSFPSGHTTAAFSVLVPFIMAYPMLSTALIPLGVLVGLSRMYLGLHYPSDVLAGCAVGTITAMATVAFFH